ncbi:MAG: hypothetical protein ACYS0G_02570 [Planctomycetota bacterium]|jgi:hypothetical protein
MKLKTMTITAGAVVVVALAAGLVSPIDKIINARGSLYLNVDADNNSTGEVLTIATDTTSDIGGAALVTVDEDGHVGIGTDSPEHILDVRGDGGDEVRIGSEDGVPMLHFRNFSTGMDWVLRHDEQYLHFQEEVVPGNEVLTLYGGGRVGIGTTDPTHPLHVYSDLTNYVLKLESGDPAVGITFYEPGSPTSGAIHYSGEVMSFKPAGTERMRIEPTGNVGIGTTNPQAPLDIEAMGDGAAVLRLSTERAWEFRQTGSGSEADLLLASLAGGSKDFIIDTEGSLYIDDGAGGIPGKVQIRSDFLRLDNDSGNMVVELNGGVGSGSVIVWDATDEPSIYLVGDEGDGLGHIWTDILHIRGGADLSEQFDVGPSNAAPEPGMVVCIDPKSTGDLIVSSKAYDRTVAGIISGAGGVTPGVLIGQSGSVADGSHPVAVAGRVYVWCDATEPIQPGDLLTTSDVPGHAMKVADYARSQGAILGKAMSPLESGRGLVLVLVSLQ